MTSPRSLILVLAIALACALIPAGTASASSGALRVLIAYSDGTHTETNFKNQIAALPGVAAADTVNAGAATPSLPELQAYDVVVTFSNTDYANSTTLGNNLASYADMGGVVVEFAFDWAGRVQRQLGGRWSTGGYSPYNVATAVINPGGALGAHEASSPLLAGVTGLVTTAHQNPPLAPGAAEVAKWSDGESAIAFKGRAVGVNACVADGCDPFSGDFARLVLNAAKTSVVGQLLAPDQTCRPDTFLQTGVAAGNSYKVPSPGVITAWYVQDGAPLAQDVRLKVARKTGPDAFALLGESPAGVRAAGQVNGPFPARITASGGDVIGLSTAGDGPCAKAGGASDTFVFPTTGPLTADPTPVVSTSGARFSIEAIVEPDGDNDGFGDLTQDRCLAAPGSVNGCRTADLALSLTATAPTVALGHEVTYTLTAVNNGPDPAPDIVVTNALPQASATTTSLGMLAAGETRSVDFVAKPTVAGPATDTATIASGADDPNTGNNSASATTFVTAPAVLSNLRQAHSTWREPGRGTRKRVPVGTTFKFDLDQAAPVVLRFTQRTVVRGTLRLRARAGLNKVSFLGALTRKKKLRPGGYKLVATATTPGVGSTSKTLRFTIVK
jgi:uncharacterized repeat protein (TIGR01451 family)